MSSFQEDWCADQGRRKQFESGQAIIKIVGPGVLPRKILKKVLLTGAFWCYFKGK